MDIRLIVLSIATIWAAAWFGWPSQALEWILTAATRLMA